MKMPSFDKGMKMLHIESSATIGNLRSFEVSALRKPNDPDRKFASIDWHSDTWNNTNSKPSLIISVGDEVYQVPSKNYEYKNNGNKSYLKIYYNIKYKPEDSEIRFYLCDKNIYNEKTKTIKFIDQNNNILKPININDNTKYNIIFHSTTTIEHLKNKGSINFAPLGTLILFDRDEIYKNLNQFTIKSNYLDFDCNIDLKTGRSQNNKINTQKTFYLHKFFSSDYIYGLYCIQQSNTEGTVSISSPDSKENTYNISDSFTFSGKSINLSIDPIGKRDWFVTRWQGDSISIYHIEGDKILAYYKELNSNKWIEYQCQNANGNICIKNLDKNKIYELRLFGIDNIQFTDHNDIKNSNECLLLVTQWGTVKWKTMERTFFGCRNMDVIATDIPNLTMCRSMKSMFYFCNKLKCNKTISRWNVSNVESMESMFAEAREFNQNINDWQVSNVKNMSFMFINSVSFNQPLDKWDVSNVTNMMAMFYDAKTFNQIINNWNVANVKIWSNIFHGTEMNKNRKYKPKKFR